MNEISQFRKHCVSSTHKIVVPNYQLCNIKRMNTLLQTILPYNLYVMKFSVCMDLGWWNLVSYRKATEIVVIRHRRSTSGFPRNLFHLSLSPRLFLSVSLHHVSPSSRCVPRTPLICTWRIHSSSSCVSLFLST